MQEIKSKLSILLSEHDADDQFIFRKAIDEIGMDIKLTMVYNSQELLDFMNKKNTVPDLILVDIKAPFFELSTLRHIQANKLFADVPVYLFAEYHYTITSEKALEFGAEGLITKPDSIHVLKRIIKSMIDKELNRRQIQI